MRVIGIDVGGPKKGFDAVVLEHLDVVERLRTADVAKLCAWCLQRTPQVVAVDAPCRWRAAERAFVAQAVNCYFTPTQQRARGHKFYAWMLPGADLFAALEQHFPLFLDAGSSRPASIETFPHAVASALAGRVVSAKPADKRRVRSELLRRAGLALTEHETLDQLDALLCALAARAFALGRFTAHGDTAGGYIVVPRDPLPSTPRPTKIHP